MPLEVIPMGKNDKKHPCEATERVASPTECTGLVPALTDEEGDEYARQLYAIELAKRRGQR